MKAPSAFEESQVSRMNAFDVFLPTFLLEKLRSYVYRVLSARKERPNTVIESKVIIVTYVLAASYGTNVSVMTATENEDFYYQTGISGKRYVDIWAALSGTKKGRQRRDTNGRDGEGWFNKPVVRNQMITELEQELSAINRNYLYVPGQTVFSLHDDHQRL